MEYVHSTAVAWEVLQEKFSCVNKYKIYRIQIDLLHRQLNKKTIVLKSYYMKMTRMWLSLVSTQPLSIKRKITYKTKKKNDRKK